MFYVSFGEAPNTGVAASSPWPPGRLQLQAAAFCRPPFVDLQAQIQTVLAAVLRCARPLGGHGGKAAAKHAVLQLRK